MVALHGVRADYSFNVRDTTTYFPLDSALLWTKSVDFCGQRLVEGILA